ncbi:MAG: gliding motility-associated C-terminal domain-containing protein [Saprospiraceae bacterium]
MMVKRHSYLLPAVSLLNKLLLRLKTKKAPGTYLLLAALFSATPGLFAQCPTIAAIMVDACGSEADNEFIIINAGSSGFNVSDLEIDYDVNNNIIGPENNDVNLGPSPCGVQAGNPAVVTGCTNVIAAGPGTFIPPNSYVVFQTSAGASAAYNFSAVCGAQQCIYVVRSTCFRSAGAFTNSSGSGLRTTGISINGACVSTYTYNTALLTGGNGAYFIPPGSYGNAGCTAPPVSFGNPPTAPMLSGVPPTICQSDPPIVLPTPQNGINGNWSGTGVSGNTFNPAGINGSNTLTFNPTPGQCAATASTIIVVTASTTPAISGVPATICQTDPAINLPTNQSGINGTWSGMGVSGNTFNPAGLNGAVTLTFTPNAGQCASAATTSITVNPAISPAITGVPASICEGDPAIALPTLQGGINGTWSGTGVSGNTFNPAGQSGNIILTFTPNAGQCANPATAAITVTPANTPLISGVPASLCQTDPAILLPTNQGGINGNWSGTGVSGNSFNPAGLSGIITLTFTPTAGQCATTATTTINVNVPITPIITGVPAAICQSDPAIPLPTGQSGINGNWSGTGVSGNTFNPAGLSGNIILTFMPTAGQCATTATTSINVNVPTSPVISGLPASLCEGDPPIALPTSQSSINGNWSGLGVSGNTFNPAGLSGNITLTFTPTAGQCAIPATTSINVTMPVPPILTGIPPVVCQGDPAVMLPATQNGITGNWSGNGVFGNVFDPTGLSGNVVLTFTPNFGQCAAPAFASIFVTSGTTPVITGVPNPLCETDLPVALPTNQSGVSGNWSGPGVAGNIFNPVGITGNVTLTFTPNPGQCASPATAEITITQAASPTITGIPNSICENGPGIALPSNQGGYMGSWSGMGVSGNNFNPTGLSGNVILIFTPDAGQCATTATTTIAITPAAIPTLLMDTLCANAPPINLSTLADPAFPAGTWSGPGVSGGNFNPAGQSGNVTLTFTPSAGCVNPATTTVTVNQLATPQLGTDAICQNNGLYNLAQLADPNWTLGTWSGTGVSGNNFNPTGLTGSITLTFNPTPDCVNNATTTITVLTPPSFSGLSENCDPATQTYTVSFDITGGDPASYMVNGDPVGGSTFTSAPIASGTPYVFQLDDGNSCGPVTISGVENCACVTNAGTMVFTGSPLLICPQGGFTVNYNFNQVLDPDDVLAFVLHDNAGAALGNIFAISSNTAFPASIPGIILGQTYYVSAIAGNDDGSGNPDVNDPCLSVSQGIPVIFHRPTIQLSPDAAICQNECYDVLFDFEGVAPFILEYNLSGPGIPGTTFTYFDIYGDTTISICPADYGFTSGNLEINVVGFEDAVCTGDSGLFPSTFIQVVPSAAATLQPTLCSGSQVVVNGTIYNEANPTGSETFVGGSYLGCDSTVNISLSFYPPAVLDLNETLCPGSSLTVNGTVYNESNPTGTEILQNASANGCDSTINISLTFNSVVTGDLDPTLCPGGSVTINGITYDDTNPSGSQTFPGGSYLGCDSTLNISLSFYPPAIFNLNEMLCTGGSLTVNGTLYDEANPSGTAVLPNASWHGCDSIVNVNLSFASEVVQNLNTTLCPGGAVTVNGTVYDAANPSGSETFPNGSYLGCDSIVNVNLLFYPPAIFNLGQTLCTGGSVAVNGTVYNEANPSGTEVLPNASYNGCDSTVNISLVFNSQVVYDLNQTLCPGGSVTVNGTIYDQTTPNGSETFPGGSYLGCDSTVNVNLSFYPAAVFNLAQSFCTGGSVTVNGTVYDANNPTGTEVLAGASVNGCDSTVNISLTFTQAVVTNINSVLCSGDFLVVNGQVYDESNPNGTETFPGGSYLGCDSMVNVSLAFYPPAVFDLVETLCANESITVNGTVYDTANPSGTEVFQNANGCDSTVNVNLSFLPVASFLLNDQLCTGGSITVNGTVYNEANPSGMEVLPNAAANGCDSTVIVDLTFGDEVVVNFNPVLCPGESIFINGTLYFAGNTSGSETFPDASYLGCDSTVNITLSFYPEAVFYLDTILLPGQSILVNGTEYGQNNLGGTEVIQGGSSSGCDSVIFVTVTVEGLTTAEIVSLSPTCKGGNDGFISIENLTGGLAPYTIALNGTNSMQVDSNDFPVVYNGLEIGFYTITIVDATNKVTTQDVFLPEPPPLNIDLGPDQTIQLGQSTSLNAMTDFSVLQYQWSPTDYLDCTDCESTQVVRPGDDVTYTLTVTSGQGCTATAQVSIFVEKTYTVFAPNAFSPNNDGINDEFTLFSGAQATVVKTFLIFDRWGNNVYEIYNMPLNDLEFGWDGRFKGKPLDPAVFVWLAEVEFVDGHVEMFEGGVTLVR